MDKEKNFKPEAAPAVDDGSVVTEANITAEMKKQITQKIAELKEKHKLKKIVAIVVEGEEDDEKPMYIGYFKRPNFAELSMFMIASQQDQIQASKALAQNIFIEGDSEMVDDDDIFLYGTMGSMLDIINRRRAKLVK